MYVLIKTEDLKVYLLVDRKGPAGEQNPMMQETCGDGTGYPREGNAFR